MSVTAKADGWVPLKRLTCVQFAEAACGDATVMLNGAIAAPFDTSRSVPPLPSAFMGGGGVF